MDVPGIGGSQSGYYAWKRRPPSRRSQEDQVLAERIAQISPASRRTSGRPRLQAELRAQGQRCGRRRIARLMRQRGRCARRQRSHTCTTDRRHNASVAPNRRRRVFTAERAKEKGVADSTGIWTSQGWLYLAVVLDIVSRKVIGWAMAARREDDLVLAALRIALIQRRPQAGLLHPADRGRQ